MNVRRQIAGAPLWYEREGTPSQRGFQFDPKFYRELEECFLEIAEFFKPLVRVVTAGAYVDKPGSHGLGRGFDLDGIDFEGGPLWSARDRTRLTAAIQCVFMRKFGVVLGWTYDERHADHLHIDDTQVWGFRDNSRSIVSFTQWVLNFQELGSDLLKLDGVWGKKTEDIFWLNFGRPTVRVLPTNAEYKTFLSFAAQKFFSQMKRETELKLPMAKKLTHEETLEKVRDIVAAALQEGDL